MNRIANVKETWHLLYQYLKTLVTLVTNYIVFSMWVIWHQLNCCYPDHCPLHQMKTVMINILDQVPQELITELLVNTQLSPSCLGEYLHPLRAGWLIDLKYWLGHWSFVSAQCHVAGGTYELQIHISQDNVFYEPWWWSVTFPPRPTLILVSLGWCCLLVVKYDLYYLYYLSERIDQFAREDMG